MMNSWQDVIKRIILSTIFDFAAQALINASEGKSMQTKISMSDALSDLIELLHATPEPTVKMNTVV
jgi:hypothetical protein